MARSLVLDTGGRWDPEPFQVAIIDALCRGVDRVWVEVPEGNAKTTTVAGITLLHLFLVDDADVPVAAASRDQAGTLLRQAFGLVRRSPGWDARFRLLEGYRRVTCPETGGRLQVFAADAGTGDGVIPTLAVLEELHRHRDLSLYRTWSGKLMKRRGQIIIISTAGEPDSEYEVAKANALAECEARGRVVRTPGLIVGAMPGFEIRIHAVAAGADVDDMAVVKQANPLRAITVEALAEKRAEPTYNFQHWARFTCGRPERDASSAVNEAEWRGLPRVEIPAGVEVAVGADFAWRHDTTAVVPFWLPGDGRRVLGHPAVLVPPRDGTSMPAGVVRDAFIEIHRRNPIRLAVIDPAASGEQFAEWLEAPPGVAADGGVSHAWEDGHGLGVEVVGVPSSNTVQAQVFASFMEAVRLGLLCHPHDPLLTSHVLNAVAKPVSHDRYRFDRVSQSRQASFQDRRVIDALVAASLVHWQQVASTPVKEEPNMDPDGLLAVMAAMTAGVE